jgi:hypothetical protein
MVHTPYRLRRDVAIESLKGLRFSCNVSRLVNRLPPAQADDARLVLVGGIVTPGS